MLLGAGRGDNFIPENFTITIPKSGCFPIFKVKKKILIKKYLFLKCQKILKKYFRQSIIFLKITYKNTSDESLKIKTKPRNFDGQV